MFLFVMGCLVSVVLVLTVLGYDVAAIGTLMAVAVTLALRASTQLTCGALRP